MDTSHSLKKILACSPKYYNRVSPSDAEEDATKLYENTRLVGLIAQDVLEFNPGAVNISNKNKGEERYGLNYQDITIHQIGAVKEQNATISALQTEVTSLRSEVELLTSQLQAIMTKLNM